MAVSFSNPTAYNPNDICGICREPLEKKQVVAHDGPNGANHPIQRL
ncbi:MAG: hypothetical protein WCP39_05540 [Chlamydiota bacterium]